MKERIKWKKYGKFYVEDERFPKIACYKIIETEIGTQNWIRK